MRRLVGLLLVGSMSVVAAAQTVHTVGSGQTHAQLQDAINAAQDGDVVLVAAGSYAPFSCSKAVLIRAMVPGALVTVVATFAIPQAQWQLGATRSAGVDGLTFDCMVYVAPAAGGGAGGVLAAESVVFGRGLDVTDAAVSLARCSVTGMGTYGLLANGAATVSATASTFRRIGAASLPLQIDAVHAADQSVLLLSRCELTGGLGLVSGHPVFYAGNGLSAAGDARVSLADCTVQGFVYVPGQPLTLTPGFAIDNQSNLPVVADRCTITNTTAPITQGVIDTTSYRLGATTPTPRLVGGTAFQVDFDARPGLPVVVHAAFGLQRPQLLLPVLAQPEWGFVADSFPIAFLIPDAAGHASVSVPLPASPTLQHRAVWFLAWSGIDLPLQLSPPVGGWLD